MTDKFCDRAPSYIQINYFDTYDGAFRFSGDFYMDEAVISAISALLSY